MNGTNAQTRAVKRVIDRLIQTATNYDIDQLDDIYHDELQVLMIDTLDNINQANKETFKALFQSKKEASAPPMNTWAKYHQIDVDGNNAHALLSRKNNLNGANMILLLSIDLTFEDERWQVKREVIFLRPDE